MVKKHGEDNMKLMSERSNHVSNHWQDYLIGGICLVLFLIPFFSGKGYAVGGDQSQLYYIYPEEYLKNYLFSIGFGNVLGGATGYAQTIFSVPIVSLFLIVKMILPTINTQHVFFGINVSLGFFFCYLFFRLFDAKEGAMSKITAILASCLYITSPYIVKTLYQSGLIEIYLVMLMPFFLYTVTRGLEEKNLRYIVLSALGVMLFSSALLSLPRFLPFFIVFLPYFIYCAFRYRSFFWKSLVAFIILSIGLHWYWLVHGVASILSSRFDTFLSLEIVSKQFIENAEGDMISSKYLNVPIHQIAGYLRTSWQDFQPMSPWNLFGSIAIGLLIIAGINIKDTTNRNKLLFVTVLFSFCIGIFMITPNMGKWNMDLFLFLNRSIPLFSMFRNMAGKFGLAMALISAFGIFLSLGILSQTKGRFIKWISFMLGALLLVFQIPQFLTSQGIGSRNTNITGLSREYHQLTEYISGMNTTKRFVWYPMTFPSYTPIRDAIETNNWYVGVSPLQSFTGASDISGFYELQTDRDPYRNWKILELFKQRNYEDIVSILASYNIGYIIAINKILPDDVQKKLDLFSFITVQTQGYKDTLLGKKIYDVGDTYSLYAINPEYAFDTAFLTNNPLDIHAPKETIAVRQTKTNVYEVTVLPGTDFQSLVLLTPYHILWKTTVPQGHDNCITLTNHRRAYEFGNVWDVQKCKNFIDPVTLTIEFVPNKFIMPSVTVSIVFFIGCSIYICYPKKRK